MSDSLIKFSDHPPASTELLGDIRRMIEETRAAVATAINADLTMLYWRIGRRIGQKILKGKRSEYGEQIVHSLSAQLSADYGRGFSKRNRFHFNCSNWAAPASTSPNT